jgi:hypothetical protein
MGSCSSRPQEQEVQQPNTTTIKSCEVCHNNKNVILLEHLQTKQVKQLCEICLRRWHACVLKLQWNPILAKLHVKFASCRENLNEIWTDDIIDSTSDFKSIVPPPTPPSSPVSNFGGHQPSTPVDLFESPPGFDGLLPFQDIDISTSDSISSNGDLTERKKHHDHDHDLLFQQENLEMYKIQGLPYQEWTPGDLATITRRTEWNVVQSLSRTTDFLVECQNCSRKFSIQKTQGHICHKRCCWFC